MKTLVVFYSRTGVTRTVAQALAGQLQADIEELHDRKKRAGALGFIVGGKDACLKRLTEIDPPVKDPAAYDLVVIGTPVWADTMAPAVRTYLSQRVQSLRNVAFFCTMMGSGDKKTFVALEEVVGKPPKGVLALLSKQVKSGTFAPSVQEFAMCLAGSA